MTTKYGRWTISSVRCRSAYPYPTSYGVSVWQARNGGRGYTTYPSQTDPYHSSTSGEPFLSGKQTQWVLQNDDEPITDRQEFSDVKKMGDRRRFVKSKGNGEIVFHPYYIMSASLVARSGFITTLDGLQTKQLSGWMGLDGQFYYDSQLAMINTGAYFRMEVNFVRQEVERQSIFDVTSAEWYPTTPSVVQPQYYVDTGLVTSVLASANSGELDLLTEVLELPETIKYLIQLMDAGGKVTLRYRKKVEDLKRIAKLKKAAGKVFDLADALASAWLQYRYAIMPIFYSIEDIRSVLKNYKRVYAKFKDRIEVPLDISFNVPGWEVTSNSVETTHRCIIKRSYDPDTLIDKLLNMLKLNPIATAWELVTLSFVVDWFVNIGDIIDALTGFDGSIQSSACYSWKTTGSATLTHKDSGATLQFTIDEYKREVIEPSDHIGLSWNSKLTWKQQIDALALLWGPISMRLRKQLK